VTLLDRDVGMADAGPGYLYHHFIGCRVLKLERCQSERPADFLYYCGRDLHPFSLSLPRRAVRCGITPRLRGDLPNVGVEYADPDVASVAERRSLPRHHIGRFLTPQKRYFAARTLV
jgi:hypothetical protein